MVNDSFEDYIDKYYVYWQRLIPNRIVQQVFAPIWPEVKHVWTRDIFRDVFDHHAPQIDQARGLHQSFMYLEAKTFLHGLLLVEDKLSMAHSVETRVPFLDNDLVDFAMRLPVSLKLANLGEVVRMNENEPGSKEVKYFERTNDGKLLLRNVMARYIPPEVANGEKQGFSAPDASWFKGESMDYVRQQIITRTPEIYEYLDRKTSESLVNEHLYGRQNRRH